ncbi:MAG: RNase A-like domain-containing protein [Thermoanaerobaculia bacterium]
MALRLSHRLRSLVPLLLAVVAIFGATFPADAARKRDLLRDEKRGGHTLSRHVGKSDAQLRERLRREHRLSAASTWTDRATAEEAVSAAISANRIRIERWTSREGSRANLVIDWPGERGRVLGRSLRRGAKEPVPCTRAVVVLRWSADGEIYYVLTSYPEASR